MTTTHPTYTQARIDSAVTPYLVYPSIIGALGTGIALTALLVKDTSGDTGLAPLLGWIGMLPSLAGLLAVTLLWMSAARRLPLMPVLLALAAAIVLAACAPAGGDPADAALVEASEVVAKDNRFDPVAVEVPAGTTVTWRFEDGGTPHDVTGDGWRSGEPQRSGSFAHTFDRSGTYPYRCTLHAGMDGRVVVTGS